MSSYDVSSLSCLLILSLGGEVQRGIAGHTTSNSLAVAGAHYPPTYQFANRRRSLLVHADSDACDPAACDPDACGMNGDTNGSARQIFINMSLAVTQRLAAIDVLAHSR